MDEDTDRRGFLAAVATGAAASVGTAAGHEDHGNESESAHEGNETEATGTDTGTGSGGSTTHEVAMITQGSEYIFDPIGLHVEPGDTVRWVIESGAHSATAYAEDNGGASERRIPEGADAWNSGVLAETGAEFEYTFEEEGTYDYFCIPHKTLGMVGRIVCGEPGGPAEESENPDAGAISSGEFPSSEAIVEQGSLGYPYDPSDVGGGGDGGTGGGGGGAGLPVSITQLGLGAAVVVVLALVGRQAAERYDNAKAALIVSSILGVLLMASVVYSLVWP